MGISQSDEQLVALLREVNHHAKGLGYHNAVNSLVMAVGRVFNPSGSGSIDDLRAFNLNEYGLLETNGQQQAPGQEESFQASLQRARALAEKTGKNKVVEFIDAAAKNEIPYVPPASPADIVTVVPTSGTRGLDKGFK